jgi:hypothetical protein
MPKGKKTRTVYRKAKSYAQRAYRGKKTSNHAISGGLAGLVGVLGSKVLGNWSQPVADLGTGYFMANDTLMTLGGRTIGAQLASGGLGIVGLGGNGTVNGSTNAILG